LNREASPLLALVALALFITAISVWSRIVAGM
jgi:hypothetical protein